LEVSLEQVKTMSVLNFGSLNIDHVYRVASIVRPGETISSRAYQVFAGGKGANQSAALASAEAMVTHAGRLGADGRWLAEKLYRAGVLTRHIEIDEKSPSGHAVIQVDDNGQNAIFLFPGTNRQITEDQIARVLDDCEPGTVVLLQNEINGVDKIIEEAFIRGLSICLNPAPFGPEVLDYPIDKVDLLVVNQTEAAGVAGLDGKDPADDRTVLARLAAKYPGPELLMTLGAQGAFYRRGTRKIPMPVGLEDLEVDITVQTRPGPRTGFDPARDKGADLGVLLVEQGVVNARELMAAILTQAKAQPLLPLEDVIWKMGLAGTDVISQAVAAQRGLSKYDITEPIFVPSQKVNAVDTTAAGDTFIGYYLAFRLEGKPIESALQIATRAAGICVTRPGAMDAIPNRAEVLDGYAD
jgi:ribokinase